MTHQRSFMRRLLIIGLLVFGLTTGCGTESDEVPSDAVARVGDTLITAQQVRSFPLASAKDARARERVSRFLILAEWVRRDAKREEVSVPEFAVERFLGSKNAGTSNAVALAKSTLLIRELIRKATGPPPTAQQIARFYREHPREYISPEMRRVRLVATSSRARAIAARRALERGHDWNDVISRYSAEADPPSPTSGDETVQPGVVPEALDAAIYAARKGRLVGPVKTAGRWYVFELTHIDRLPARSLAQARGAVRLRLEVRRHAEGNAIVQRRLHARYRPMTVCNERLLLPQCRNGPRPKLGSTPFVL